MKVYIDVLTNTGWVVMGDVSNETTESVVGSTMHQKILALVAVALGPFPTAALMVKAALTALQAMNQNSPCGESPILSPPRFRVDLESGCFAPDSVDLAGDRGVGVPARRSVLGRRSVAQGRVRAVL
jgi:hypothetical protein